MQMLKLAPDDGRPPCPVGPPAKDQPLYRAARACKANVLLTGDSKDFGFLMNDRRRAEGLLVQTVGAFLDHLLQVLSASQSLAATSRAKVRKSSRWREHTAWTMSQLMRS
jgi:hypothetical protein